ncbi:ATP-binding protein [Streptomyces sp. NPDC001985]|uniref:ATP-binding protein n=1 Tax=Streptomyces sp. NPDC001985 TaxID=3154406 RepID=UPI003329DEEC
MHTSTASTPSTTPAPFSGARLRIEAPSDPTVARKARDWLTAPLRTAHPQLADDVLLCLSEVVTNAHRHTTAATIRVDAHITDAHVVVRVRDNRAGALPRPAGSRSDEERGRGLTLLDAFADSWGVTPLDGRRSSGKSVWFRLTARRRDPG